ncbi:hypothetical protein LCGC14_3075110, partial [marine sediment metagenome]
KPTHDLILYPRDGGYMVAFPK